MNHTHAHAHARMCTHWGIRKLKWPDAIYGSFATSIPQSTAQLSQWRQAMIVSYMKNEMGNKEFKRSERCDNDRGGWREKGKHYWGVPRLFVLHAENAVPRGDGSAWIHTARRGSTGNGPIQMKQEMRKWGCGGQKRGSCRASFGMRSWRWTTIITDVELLHPWTFLCSKKGKATMVMLIYLARFRCTE